MIIFPEMRGPEEITQLRQDWTNGDQNALNDLLPLVYDELRRQASSFLKKERIGHTLQTTALINEAYLRLIGQNQVEWQNRNHFFAIASTAMRRILVDHARNRHREKRGGAAENVAIDDALQISVEERSVDLIALDAALDRLAKLSARQARVVELRYFSGLSNEETADVLGVSKSTVKNDWNIARAWLRVEIAN